MLLALGVVSNSSLANDEVEIGYYRQLLLDQKFGVLEKDLRLVNDGYLNDQVSWSKFYEAFDGVWFLRDKDNPRIEENLKKMAGAVSKLRPRTIESREFLFFSRNRKTWRKVEE